MSGTSMDGVDGVLASFADDGRIATLAATHLPFPDTLRSELMAMHAALLHTLLGPHGMPSGVGANQRYAPGIVHV